MPFVKEHPMAEGYYYWPASVVELIADLRAGLLDDELEEIYWEAKIRRDQYGKPESEEQWGAHGLDSEPESNR